MFESALPNAIESMVEWMSVHINQSIPVMISSRPSVNARLNVARLSILTTKPCPNVWVFLSLVSVSVAFSAHGSIRSPQTPSVPDIQTDIAERSAWFEYIIQS